MNQAARYKGDSRVHTCINSRRDESRLEVECLWRCTCARVIVHTYIHTIDDHKCRMLMTPHKYPPTYYCARYLRDNYILRNIELPLIEPNVTLLSCLNLLRYIPLCSMCWKERKRGGKARRAESKKKKILLAFLFFSLPFSFTLPPLSASLFFPSFLPPLSLLDFLSLFFFLSFSLSGR